MISELFRSKTRTNDKLRQVQAQLGSARGHLEFLQGIIAQAEQAAAAVADRPNFHKPARYAAEQAHAQHDKEIKETASAIARLEREEAKLLADIRKVTDVADAEQAREQDRRADLRAAHDLPRLAIERDLAVARLALAETRYTLDAEHYTPGTMGHDRYAPYIPQQEQQIAALEAELATLQDPPKRKRG